MIIIPAQTGALFSVPEGSALRIVDLEGQQIADMFAVCADDFDEFLGARTTRAASASVFPAVGDAFLSVNYRPMMLFEADNSAGPHDLLAPPCSAQMYAALGFEGYHRSCSDNFRAAADPIGWTPELVPDPVDWFQNTPVTTGGAIDFHPALTAPGDSVTLRALTDLHVIISACPMDLPSKPINGDRCTGIGVEALG